MAIVRIPNGPRAVRSVSVERHRAGLKLAITERPLDLTQDSTQYETDLTWTEARTLFHNLASQITTDHAIRESEG